MKMIYRAVTAMILPILAGCTTTDRAFHPLALGEHIAMPKGDTFVVGVEKARRGYAGAPVATCSEPDGANCVQVSAIDAKQGKEVRELYEGQFRPTFISHVALFRAKGQDWCFLVNDYEQGVPCEPDAVLKRAANGTRVVKSWDALKSLKKALNEYVAMHPPSHIVVYSMGWNTLQEEALANIRDLEEHLLNAGANNPNFRPLFIAVTWPSTGSPKVPKIDYGIKAKDADEVGLIWANVLINDVLKSVKASTGIPIVVVGHSFGARLTSRAVFSSALIGAPKSPVVDLLVGLQGAYTFQRFVAGAGIDGSPYWDFSNQVGQVVLTSSEHDKAVKIARHARYFVGSDLVFKRTKEGDELPKVFAHATLGPDGAFSGACNAGKVLMLDASQVIKTADGASGAHSDIYDAEIGKLTYDLIAACVKN